MFIHVHFTSIECLTILNITEPLYKLGTQASWLTKFRQGIMSDYE